MAVFPRRLSSSSIFRLRRTSKSNSKNSNDIRNCNENDEANQEYGQGPRPRRIFEVFLNPERRQSSTSTETKRSRKKNSNKRNARRRRSSATERLSDPDEAMILLTLIRMNEWEAAMRQLAASPQGARLPLAVHETSTPSFRLPLHEACRRKAPMEVIHCLLRAYPEAVYAKDTLYQFLPIHFACRYGAPPSVVETLLGLFPESVHAEDRYGNTPACLVRWGVHENKAVIRETIDSFLASMQGEKQQQEMMERTREVPRNARLETVISS